MDKGVAYTKGGGYCSLDKGVAYTKGGGVL